jgi:hypothetical protein
MAGVGGFKTAHHKWLSFIPLPASGLGSLTCHKIVVKRPFHKVNTGPLSYKIDRFALADSDVLKIFKEANVPYWAKSLLQFTYGFIDRCLSPLSRVSHLNPPASPVCALWQPTRPALGPTGQLGQRSMFCFRSTNKLRVEQKTCEKFRRVERDLHQQSCELSSFVTLFHCGTVGL